MTYSRLVVSLSIWSWWFSEGRYDVFDGNKFWKTTISASDFGSLEFGLTHFYINSYVDLVLNL